MRLGWDRFVQTKRGRIFAPSPFLTDQQNRKLVPEMHEGEKSNEVNISAGTDIFFLNVQCKLFGIHLCTLEFDTPLFPADEVHRVCH